MKTLNTLVLSALMALTLAVAGAASADDGRFSQAELDSMLAPVALYPDSVLSHLLIAATYPLEVIQAARWSREHPDLRGEAAVAAVEHFDWDPSVKALAAFPELLARMDEDLDWTQNLGDAFLMQEDEVIASIQYLRSEAYAGGKLQSDEHVRVVREKEYIYIEPARTRVIYVPYYDPRVVYTSWRWASYPPVWWHRPAGYSLGLSFYWGTPYYIAPSFYFSSFHWATRRVVVVNHHHYYHQRRFRSARQVARFDHARHWQHNPVHRRGVSYRGPVAKTRFVDNHRPAAVSPRATTRARPAVRANQRDWAARQRSSIDFDRQAASRSRASARSDRVARLRGANRGESSPAIRAARPADARSTAANSGQRRAAADRSGRTAPVDESRRTVTGRAPARAAAGRGSDAARSSLDRAGRVGESLRSAAPPRASASREPSISSRAAPRSSPRRSRSPIPVPDSLTIRSSQPRTSHAAPPRPGSSRMTTPTRAATIDHSPGRASVPGRPVAPAARSSLPSRSQAPSPPPSSTPAPTSRSPVPARSIPSAPSSEPSRAPGSSNVPSRSGPSASPGRSRGGDSGRGGRSGRR